jgi:hypothetical protein
MAKKAKSDVTTVSITPANLKVVPLKIVGTAPYVQNKFSSKAKQEMMDKQSAGGTAKKGSKKAPKDFDQCCEDAKYATTGKNNPNGYIPATAIKAAMVAACRLVDFQMTSAKQCVYVHADAYDKDELIPLINITKGKPRRFDQAVRIPGTADIRSRPMWDAGWEATVRIEYDADRFTLNDVVNLLSRAGQQVGIGEGRQASRQCVGLGWGTFKVV